MGQYYMMFNWNREAFSKNLGKWGEFDPSEVMKELGWTEEEAIVAVGDYGDQYAITESAEPLIKQEETY